jgi:hypothetical protein
MKSDALHEKKNPMTAISLIASDGRLIACSGDIAVRFGDAVKGEKKLKDDPELITVELSAVDTADGAYAVRRSSIEKGFTTDAETSVLLPVELLQLVLNAVEGKVVRVDFLPGLFGQRTEQDVVDGAKYVGSSARIIARDALRIVEVREPTDVDKQPSVEDSAGILGCAFARSEWFVDNHAKTQSDNATLARKEKMLAVMKSRGLNT